ncbi:MAG: hypothetical protein JWO09_407 [Bacteroidetes bacterium]|nr:hypothetical protein [Bacteroidota bacterium]
MKLSEFKNQLNTLSGVSFTQPDGNPVPAHFHITEVGLTTKNFIDCGGTVREEKVVNFQLWEANDLGHRLTAEKLSKIISLSEKALGIGDHEVEVEYQTNTIGRYGVEIKNEGFVLVPKNTACLASDSCGAPKEKQKLNLVELGSTSNACCTPGGGCC